MLATSISTYAQKHHEVGIVAGVSGYRGDLSQSWIPHEKTLRPTVGVQYKYFFNPHVGIRAGFNMIQINAADSLSTVKADQLRNLSFHNRLLELQAGIEVNLLPIDMYKFHFTPYVFAGVAGYYSNPYAFDNNNEKVFLRDLSTEGQGVPGYPDRKYYSTLGTSFPIGFGLKAFIGKTVMLTAEVGLRYVTNDYIDDVSRSYINMDTLFHYRGAKSVEMSYRGNMTDEWDGNFPNDQFRRGDYTNNDWYMSATLGITVYFDAFGRSPRWSNRDCPRVFGRN